MFEKESEEWVIDSVCRDCSRYEKCKSKEHCTCKECSKEKWHKGAEFGYKKGFEECAKSRLNVTTVSDCPIKDEWHYVKDGDLPRQDGHTCFSIEVLTNNKKWVYYQFDSGKWFCGNKEVNVIAWKEIIFPKE